MIEIVPAATSTDWRHATALLHDYAEWIRVAAHLEPTAEQPELAGELRELHRHYTRPDRVIFVARDEGDPVGIAAVFDHGDGTAEIKRMYVRPIARGRGIADLLVSRALDAAAGFGCHTAWLETLRGPMDRAIAVYRRNGFSELDGPGRRLALDTAVMMARPLTGMGLGEASGGCGGF
jgi:putative acetyltransferase